MDHQPRPPGPIERIYMKSDSDYEKKELLLNAAKKEFLEKGYNKASLRTICASAGVTTGALYFFFDNKADLFAAIVDPPINELKKILFEHFSEDAEFMSNLKSLDDIEVDHSDVSDMITEHIYRYYDNFMLALNGSENTVYEHVVDDFVKLLEESVPYMLSGLKGYTSDEYMSHWMSHISIDAYIQVIKHEKDKEIAKCRLRSILNYLTKGWIDLVMVKNN